MQVILRLAFNLAGLQEIPARIHARSRTFVFRTACVLPPHALRAGHFPVSVCGVIFSLLTIFNVLYMLSTLFSQFKLASTLLVEADAMSMDLLCIRQEEGDCIYVTRGRAARTPFDTRASATVTINVRNYSGSITAPASAASGCGLPCTTVNTKRKATSGSSGRQTHFASHISAMNLDNPRMLWNIGIKRTPKHRICGFPNSCGLQVSENEGGRTFRKPFRLLGAYLDVPAVDLVVTHEIVFADASTAAITSVRVTDATGASPDLVSPAPRVEPARGGWLPAQRVPIDTVRRDGGRPRRAPTEHRVLWYALDELVGALRRFLSRGSGRSSPLPWQLSFKDKQRVLGRAPGSGR